MDPLKFTTIAHQNHLFCSPLSAGKVDQVLALLPLSKDDSVIDVGCAKGEMLIRLVEQKGVYAVGVDRNAQFLEEAESRAVCRIPGDKIAFHRSDIADFGTAPGKYAAAICVGSTHAFGSYAAAITALTRLTRPGGHILIGEGYWKQPPHPDYLAFLGASADIYSDHAGNIAAGIDAGLTSLYATVSSQDEWDHYEGLYSFNVERYVTEHPQDSDGSWMRQRISDWRAAYYRWGRDTLGFGLYLFQT